MAERAQGEALMDRCSFHHVHNTAGIKDLRSKIEAREERIKHLQEEISQKIDQINIMKCEILQFREMLKKEAGL
jgi:Skp family chaperone for outer membrane proteins